jgi:hypothetical protein
MRRSMLALLAVAGLALSSAPRLSSGANRHPLQGIWAWDASYRAEGKDQTPRSSGYGLLLTINPGGSYTLLERDSANAYLRAAGRLDARRSLASDPSARPASFAIRGWDPRYDAYTAAAQGPDTLLVFPARPGSGVADAAVQRFVRAAGDATKTPRTRSRGERPPRLVSTGYGDYEVAPPDSVDRMARLTSQFRKIPDRQYTDETRRDYRYRHDQTPAAVIGDFNGDGVYDVALYGRADSVEETVCVLDWNRAGSVVVLGKEAEKHAGDPGRSLELMSKGSRVERANQAEAVLPRDAIVAVGSDGSRLLYEWDGAAFTSTALAR